MKDYLYIDSNDDAHQSRFKVSKTPKIDYLIKEKRFDDALDEINSLLKTDFGVDNLKLKGIILNHLSRYEESCECFDEAFNLNPLPEIHDLKSNALYDWAKVTFFPELTLIRLNTLTKLRHDNESYGLLECRGNNSRDIWREQ